MKGKRTRRVCREASKNRENQERALAIKPFKVRKGRESMGPRLRREAVEEVKINVLMGFNNEEKSLINGPVV